MSRPIPRRLLAAAAVCLQATACSSSSPTGFDLPPSGNGSGSGASTSGSGFSSAQPTLGGQVDAGTASSSGSPSGATTIYADTVDALYTLDPMTNTVALVGMFSGFGSGEEATDVAVNAEGDVYVNSEVAVYKAILPTGSGEVALTNRVQINNKNSFYALAFAPPGFLGAGEALVGGDNNGELWSIDPVQGTTIDLGSFGPNPSHQGDLLGLSGDIVFYTNNGQPTGLATIRSCDSKGADCSTKDDYLAGIDMTALAAAYTSQTPAASLLTGIYGGTSSEVGDGTGFGELFGLGAWQGTVFAFGHDPAQLYTVSTTTGVGSPVASTMPDSGWAGAGVSTTTTITVAPPPSALK